MTSIQAGRARAERHEEYRQKGLPCESCSNEGGCFHQGGLHIHCPLAAEAFKLPTAWVPARLARTCTHATKPEPSNPP